jgi:hypothetical protein
MKEKYPIKPSKKQLEQMMAFWDMLEVLQDEFHLKLARLEGEMELVTGIEGIEFFRCDGDYVGIGNSARTMKLIQQDEIECA